MTQYTTLISEATGITDTTELSQIEEIMRQDIWHGTLDWQSKAELKASAKEACYMLSEYRELGLYK